MISKSKPFQWCIICKFILKFYNLYKFKALFNLPKTLSSVNSIILDFSNQAKFPKSLNMWRLRNQRIFELQKSIRCHQKAHEKLHSMMIFSKTLTDTLPSTKPQKTLKKTLKHGISMKKFQQIWHTIYRWKSRKQWRIHGNNKL